MDFTESFLAPLMAANATLNKLGQGANSVLPRVGVDIPPDRALELEPWIWVKPDDAIQTDPFTYQQVVHLWVYDLPGQQYWRINAIVADLVRLVYPPSMNVWYESADGLAGWRQDIALVSQPAADDAMDLLTRWVDVTVWR